MHVWPPNTEGDEWTHGNAVVELPDGRLALSFRNTSMVVFVDRETGELVWKLGAPPLSGQHAPTPLPNGNLLIFDNGPHRLDESLPFSRVIEVDPTTKEIVWTYQDRPLSNFFSPRISNAQRLPNGNTLICEGWFGRLFEVTADGQTVWEYVSPYFGDSPRGHVNHVFRAYRYGAEDVARWSGGRVTSPAAG
ncbi:MAG: aryl-sulfate sulfotransferase [Chloroflexi bacterium]|nr:aryl-sulfate sulfotransferase [Chloroflexota bacterium]